jgi:hypothetical protein
MLAAYASDGTVLQAPTDLRTVDNTGSLGGDILSVEYLPNGTVAALIAQSNGGNQLTYKTVYFDFGDLGVPQSQLIEGTSGNDPNLAGTAGDNYLAGGDGNDNITGLAGNDALNGGNNNDTLDGGVGIDMMFGGDGNDRIVWDENDNLAAVLGGNDTDTLAVINPTSSSYLSFNLGAHEFENAYVITTDPGGNWWSQISDYYNANWQRTNSDTFADNGNLVQTTYDVSPGGTGVNWQYISDYRNASSVLTNQDGKFDNGGSFAKSYDYAAGTGTDGISDELREFTYFFANDTDRAANKVLNVEGFYDDGRKFTQTNDIGPGANGDHAWTFQTNWTETDGVTLDFLEIRWDDGSTQIIPY